MITFILDTLSIAFLVTVILVDLLEIPHKYHAFSPYLLRLLFLSYLVVNPRPLRRLHYYKCGQQTNVGP